MTSFVQIDSTPKSAAHVVSWFKNAEAPKGVGKESDGSISIWFHGMDETNLKQCCQITGFILNLGFLSR